MSTIADELEAQGRALLELARRKRLEERARPAEPTVPTQTTFYTVREFVARHTFLTQGMLRRHLFHRTTNGLVACGAVAKMGSRVLIDEPRFLDWLRASAQAELGRGKAA